MKFQQHTRHQEESSSSSPAHYWEQLCYSIALAITLRQALLSKQKKWALDRGATALRGCRYTNIMSKWGLSKADPTLGRH